jgi:urease accessory protein
MTKKTRGSKSDTSTTRLDDPGLESDSPLDIPHSSFDPWLLWQLADSAFPTGGFAHSGGLEAAWQLGEIRGRADLLAFIEAGLQQVGHASLPIVMAAFDEPENLPEFDQLCEAFTSNHVANRASRAQGRAFLSAVERVFNPNAEMQSGGKGDPPVPSGDSPPDTGHWTVPPIGMAAATPKRVFNPVLCSAHFAPVFGATLRRLKVPRETTARMFFFHYLRGVLAAAVRLNIVGPMEAQKLQRKLSPTAEAIMQACDRLTLDQIAQTSPLLELWQGAQDRLYSRLFQS